MKSVLVLMSTYNGQKYLSQQLDSVFAQKDVNVKLLVRDDGSTDNTVSILQKYQSDYDVEILTGKNLRPAQSFRELVRVSPDCDYYAYADQDDIWMPDKLAQAIRALSEVEEEIPLLWYCGLSRLIDGNETDAGMCPLERAQSFETIVKTFWSTNGCTIVFNQKMMDILKSCDAGLIDMHDSWTNAMCLACGGKVLCDPSPYVKYRIHDNQVLGLGKKSVLDKIKRFFKAGCLRSATIQTMLTSQYLEDSKRVYLEKLMRYKSNPIIKLMLIAEKPSREMTKDDALKFRIQILTNKF